MKRQVWADLKFNLNKTPNWTDISRDEAAKQETGRLFMAEKENAQNA